MWVLQWWWFHQGLVVKMTEDSYFNTYSSSAFVYLLGTAPNITVLRNQSLRTAMSKDPRLWKMKNTRIWVNLIFDKIEKSWLFFSSQIKQLFLNWHKQYILPFLPPSLPFVLLILLEQEKELPRIVLMLCLVNDANALPKYLFAYTGYLDGRRVEML